jgi:hypothetical protein
MAEEDRDSDLDGEDLEKFCDIVTPLPRRSLVERQAAEEQFHKRRYFTKWLQEAGIIAFLDFLLADSCTAPEVQRRARNLCDRLVAPMAE